MKSRSLLTQTLFLTAASLCFAACTDEIVADDDSASISEAVQAHNVTVKPVRDRIQWNEARPLTKLITDADTYHATFGHYPPAGINFKREWVIFYFPGAQVTSGHQARVTVKRTGKHLDIITTLESPGADCMTAAVLENPYVLAKFAVPDGATKTISDVPVVRDCTTETPPEQPAANCGVRTGGALVTFKNVDEDSELFTAWVTTPSFIDEAKRLLAAGESRVPMFNVLKGTDCDDKWSFHLATEASWADMTTEVCDARPSYIEANLDGWTKVNEGRWCPWGTRVISVDDRR
jgi:hypothetical protein